MNQSPAGGEQHVNEFEMAAYLDRRMDAADRARVEGHLAVCADCRKEMLEVRGLVRRTTRPRRMLIAATLLATAATLVLIVRPATLDLQRDGDPQPTLVAYGPTGEVTLSSLRFVWAAAPGVASYRLTVSRADGAPVWSGSLSDTATVLPDSATLRVDQHYLWVADALLDDGSSRSTGLREFRPVQ